MNKSELISAIAESAGIPSNKAEKALAAALEGISNALSQGDSFSIVGFGKFGVKHRSARQVRNPRTGKSIDVDAVTVPYFKAGKNLKELVDIDKK